MVVPVTCEPSPDRVAKDCYRQYLAKLCHALLFAAMGYDRDPPFHSPMPLAPLFDPDVKH
jgi:hypothetical protein